VILCADDYALSEGVSRAIEELAAMARLSATSALSTASQWPVAGQRLRSHRHHLLIGLHLDLTLGPPLGAMPNFAPGGRFQPLRQLAARAFWRDLNLIEVEREVERQLDRFERVLGFSPDHIDAHQHVHVLPGIRRVLLKTIARRYPTCPPLVRNPSGRALGPLTHGAGIKALTVRTLALGFGQAARRYGLPVNRGFSGFSRFDLGESYAQELADALARPGSLHIIMCHPGHPDAELARRDPVVARRRMEYDVLMSDPYLPDRLWRPSRNWDGPSMDWSQVPELRHMKGGED
jgi:hypothetical protein